jgi:hypothetical protein
MRKSSVFLEPDHAGGHLALVTLQRGVSAWSAWAFDAPDAGRTITVGASHSCDWQIASPGVSPLFMAFTGEALVARAVKHDERLRLNGRILAESWVSLSHGDRLDLGPSALAISLGPQLRSKANPRKDYKQQKRMGNRRQAAAAERQERDETRRDARRAAREVALVLRDDFARNAAALFREREDDEATRQGTRMWYAAIAFATLLAYAGWLMLLDEL